MIKFCLLPGWVRSIPDGDMHYVTATALAKLHKLEPNSWRNHDQSIKSSSCADLIHLWARWDGIYHPESAKHPIVNESRGDIHWCVVCDCWHRDDYEHSWNSDES